MRGMLEEMRASLRLALPLAAAQLAQVSMGFVDTVMLGRLGSSALAAGALGGAVFFPLLIVCMGFVAAVGPMVSQAHGAGEADSVGRSVRQGLWLATLLALPAVLLLRSVEPFLLWTGQQPEIAALAAGYLGAIAWGFLPSLWFSALRNFVEGLSRPRVVMAITVIGVLFNVLANDTLMFGRYGLPALGVVGTGYASAIVFWFMFLALAAYTLWRPELRAYGVFRSLRRPDPRFFRELFRIGWPIAVLHGLEVGLFATTAFLMGRIDTVILAAHQIAIQCASVTFMVPLGIGIATSVRVGQATGRGDPEEARRAGFAGILLGAGFMVLTAVAFWTVPRLFVTLYLDLDQPGNDAVRAWAVRLLGIAAVFQVFDGIQVTAAGALRGLKDTRVPMVVGAVSYWLLGLTVGCALAFWAGWGAIGLWWGLVLGLFAAASLLLWRFRRLAGDAAPGARPAAAGRAGDRLPDLAPEAAGGAGEVLP